MIRLNYYCQDSFNPWTVHRNWLEPELTEHKHG